MDAAVLIIWLAGSGMTAKPVRVEYPSMEKCLKMADYQRARGNKARCNSSPRIEICANCGAPAKPLG
jgi:hypothetical protein